MISFNVIEGLNAAPVKGCPTCPTYFTYPAYYISGGSPCLNTNIALELRINLVGMLAIKVTPIDNLCG